MASMTGAIRLDPNVADMTPLDLDPADFQSALPQQQVHVYFSDPAIGLNVGIWETSSMQEAFGPYPGDEVIVVVEGAFAMIDAAGRGVPAHRGQCVIFRNAIPISWMQPGSLRKIYLTLLDPTAPQPVIASADGGVIVIDPAVTIPEGAAPGPEPGGGGHREHRIFRNDRGSMTVSLIETGAMAAAPAAAAGHRFVHILAGSVTITGNDGRTERFQPGEAFLIPGGIAVGWSAPHPVRMICARVVAANATPD